jgi:hypothetical protein
VGRRSQLKGYDSGVTSQLTPAHFCSLLLSLSPPWPPYWMIATMPADRYPLTPQRYQDGERAMAHSPARKGGGSKSASEVTAKGGGEGQFGST